MRLHVVSLPHTETTRDYDWCAYTAKVRRFATTMTDLGHDVFLYAGVDNDASVAEHVTLVTRGDQDAWFGGYDPSRDVWDGFQPGAEWWNTMNMRAVREITRREEPGDIVCLIAGLCQEPIAQALSDRLTVEWGVGYAGVFAEHRVYESHAWRHYVAARRCEEDFRPTDAVIPNGFDMADLRFSGVKDDYLLYVGRLTPRKGVQLAIDAARETGRQLLVIGQGNLDDYDVAFTDVEHLGVLVGEEKAKLLARAHAVLVPTQYLEPFGGVAVEAMLSGTPAITSDWGAFVETVVPGVTGFRCATPDDYVWSIGMAETINASELHRFALARYTMAVTGPQYERYLAVQSARAR